MSKTHHFFSLPNLRLESSFFWLFLFWHWRHCGKFILSSGWSFVDLPQMIHIFENLSIEKWLKRSNNNNNNNLINERKTFLWTNTKLCRTQTSFDSFSCMYNKKALMLNIYYSLKTINSLKIKKGCFKT